MSGMCCEQLVCANCGQPVVDARCSVCAASRAQVHGGNPYFSAAFVVVAITALLAIAAVLYGGLAR
jgi:hypothetical protein